MDGCLCLDSLLASSQEPTVPVCETSEVQKRLVDAVLRATLCAFIRKLRLIRLFIFAHGIIDSFPKQQISGVSLFLPVCLGTHPSLQWIYTVEPNMAGWRFVTKQRTCWLPVKTGQHQMLSQTKPNWTQRNRKTHSVASLQQNTQKHTFFWGVKFWKMFIWGLRCSEGPVIMACLYLCQ